jgi:hypothetical protein
VLEEDAAPGFRVSALHVVERIERQLVVRAVGVGGVDNAKKPTWKASRRRNVIASFMRVGRPIRRQISRQGDSLTVFDRCAPQR